MIRYYHISEIQFVVVAPRHISHYVWRFCLEFLAVRLGVGFLRTAARPVKISKIYHKVARVHKYIYTCPGKGMNSNFLSTAELPPPRSGSSVRGSFYSQDFTTPPIGIPTTWRRRNDFGGGLRVATTQH